VVDDYDIYFRQAFEKARKDQGVPLNLKYWRMLSYPVEAFRAVLEVKIRLSGIARHIEREHFPRLDAIQEKKEDCFLYYVVIDRCCNNRDCESLKKAKENYKEIYLEILPKTKQEVIK